MAPNLTKLSQLFNNFAEFVTIDILYSPNEEKVDALTFYIKVASFLKDFGDFQNLQVNSYFIILIILMFFFYF